MKKVMTTGVSRISNDESPMKQLTFWQIYDANQLVSLHKNIQHWRGSKVIFRIATIHPTFQFFHGSSSHVWRNNLVFMTITFHRKQKNLCFMWNMMPFSKYHLNCLLLETPLWPVAGHLQYEVHRLNPGPFSIATVDGSKIRLTSWYDIYIYVYVYVSYHLQGLIHPFGDD